MTFLISSGFWGRSFPTRVMEATGSGLWIFTSNSGNGPPVIRVPCASSLPATLGMTRMLISGSLYRSAFRWMNFVPLSAIPINAFMSIDLRTRALLIRLGSPVRIPGALVTRTTSSAPSAVARRSAVVSLPPRPSVLIRPSLVRPMNPPMTGMIPSSTTGFTYFCIR